MNRAKHAFGALERIDDALQSGAINAYDILFVKDEDGKPYVGWIDKDGNKVVVQEEEQVVVVEGNSLPESGEKGKVYIFGEDGYFWNGTEFVNMCKPTDLTALENEIATKADAEEVEAKINDVEAALNNVANESRMHERIKYEIVDVPVGTLVDYRDDEIRIMVPANVAWTKQAVGTGGDANCYYATFKTYVPNNNVVGYIENLNGNADPEILTDIKTDQYGRRYQPTWLAIARYDESSDSWTYYGAGSSEDRYIGWDYKISWFNAGGVMIASDCIRINLSNEECHSLIKPYYITNMASESKAYTDEQIATLLESMTVVEF